MNVLFGCILWKNEQYLGGFCKLSKIKKVVITKDRKGEC